MLMKFWKQVTKIGVKQSYIKWMLIGSHAGATVTSFYKRSTWLVCVCVANIHSYITKLMNDSTHVELKQVMLHTAQHTQNWSIMHHNE